MKRFLFAPLAIPLLLLAACTPSQNAASSGSPSARPALASGSAAASASASASASAGAATKYVELNIPVPEQNAKAGLNGMGWSVDVIAKGNGPAMDAIKPAFGATATAAGRNPAFPGLVVMLSTTPNGQGFQGAKQNLAKLFQLIALDNTNPQVARSSTSASSAPSSTPSASGSGAVLGASASPQASAATSGTTTADTTTAEATWFVQSASFGNDVDAELTVFVVEGDAPDQVSDQSSLKIVSNQLTVRFHINGGGAGGTSSTSAPRASTSPAASPTGATGSAGPSPSAKPSSTP